MVKRRETENARWRCVHHAYPWGLECTVWGCARGSNRLGFKTISRSVGACILQQGTLLARSYFVPSTSRLADFIPFGAISSHYADGAGGGRGITHLSTAPRSDPSLLISSSNFCIMATRRSGSSVRQSWYSARRRGD